MGAVTNTLCLIVDPDGPEVDIFTTNGQYIVTVGTETNMFNVQAVSPAEQALFPILAGNTLLKITLISAPTDLSAQLKTTAQQILSVSTTNRYAEYAKTYLAMDALYASHLNPEQFLAQGPPDYGPVAAQFDSFTVSNGLLRATYLYHKGLAQLRARRGSEALSTWCMLLNEFPEGLHPNMAREWLGRIYSGAAAWYPLNEGVGATTANMVCNGASGLLVGVSLPVWVNGLEGKALQFNGSGYVMVSNAPALTLLTNRLSLSAWVKASPTNSGPIISRTVAGGSAGSYSLSLSNGHVVFKVFLGGAATAATSTNPLPDSLWHHLAGIYDGVNLRVYLDGADAGSVAAAGAVDVVTEPLLLGRHADGNSFVGVIDDVRVFGRALTAEDVADIFNMDSDADGLSNVQELNMHGTDPAKADTDGDGLGDGDEVGIHGTSPVNADSDGDGVSDYHELWDRGTDPRAIPPA